MQGGVIAQSRADRLRSSATKAEKRVAFRVALQNGATVAEASRSVGVHRNTGLTWARQFREATDLDASKPIAISSKGKVAEVLSNLVESDATPPPYKVNAATALSRLMGYDAPTRSQVEVRTVPASVSAWLDTIDAEAIDVTPEPLAIETNARPALTHNETAPRLSAPPHDTPPATDETT